MSGSMQNAPRSHNRRPLYSAAMSELIRTLKSLVDGYHPERHYMRGPGPKWHAKHDRPTAPEPADLAALERLHV